MRIRLILLALVAASALAAQSKKVVIMGMPDALFSELRSAAPSTVELVNVTRPGASADVVAIVADSPEAEARAKMMREIADADAIIGNPSLEMVRAAKELEWVQITSAGVKPYLYPDLVNSDVVMTNAKTLSSEAIADHGFAMLLALTRRLYVFMPARDREEWDRRNHNLQQLKGKTAVVIGTGGIGSNVAQRAQAFGMRVIGVDPEEFPPRPAFDRMVYPDRLDEVLPEADAIFVCAPHTEKSEGMLGAKQFELMKRGAYFIALSRGKLYDMNALVKALDSEHLAGAGVDVTDPEPLPKGHPLWEFDNAIITPHVATQGEGGTPNRMELYKDNVARFAAGERLRNVVDMHKQY